VSTGGGRDGELVGVAAAAAAGPAASAPPLLPPVVLSDDDDDDVEGYVGTGSLGNSGRCRSVGWSRTADEDEAEG